MNRFNGRAANSLRSVTLDAGVIRHAEGSCMAKFGETHVLCVASVEERVPPFLKNSGNGWITAEYGMLPRATLQRTEREAAKGKQTGRTQEIQRLIGRSLRAVVDMGKLGERTIRLDCDVIQADGGTRTAAITGAYVALYQAMQGLMAKKLMKEIPLSDGVAAISCGIVEGVPLLDLDYLEDSTAETDANFIITATGGLVEIQATAEKTPFTPAQLQELLQLAANGTAELAKMQRQALGIVV
jgi:ribonuclease PH